ncbi:hypothetical protein TSAR_015084, partial [Trichomalopsis sarcophagae]
PIGKEVHEPRTTRFKRGCCHRRTRSQHELRDKSAIRVRRAVLRCIACACIVDVSSVVRAPAW